MLGATAGATTVFVLARTVLADPLRRLLRGRRREVESTRLANAFTWIVALRLMPLFPFVVVNLVPAFAGVGIRTYVLATLLGIIPGTAVFAYLGAGLGEVFERSPTFDPASALTPETITALVGLSVLSMAPVVYRRVKGRSAAN